MTTLTRPAPHLLHVLSDQVLRPPPARRALARRRYLDLAAYLERHMSDKLVHRVWVYPQGSYRLGTTILRFGSNEFDVDIVIAYDRARGDLSQNELVMQMHGWLVRYFQTGHGGGELQPSDYSKGGRAFTLKYDDDFHIDVLPVVIEKPSPTGCLGQPSWLPDRDLVRWQPTNPRGFAEHFEAVARPEMRMLAKAAEIEVDDLPDAGQWTELQRAVVLFKGHRDQMFADDEDGIAPPSALITALATAAYDAAGPNASIVDIVTRLEDGLERRPTGLWVPNPAWPAGVSPQENYADRYAGRPDKQRELRRWLDEVVNDVTGLDSIHGLDSKRTAISKAWGAGTGERAVELQGQTLRERSRRGQITGTAAGLAIGRPSRPRPPFHGDQR